MAEECREKAVSEEYIDFLWKARNSLSELKQQYPGICVQTIGAIYAVLYVDGEFLYRNPGISYPYEAFPTLYGLQQTEALEESGILQIQNQTVLQAKGQGVILGFIDTGIDYRNACFRDAAGNSRILEIWDQTVQSGTPPAGIVYGSIYGNEIINRALKSQDPFAIVPSRDENGHGTRMASIAAGSEMPEQGWIGAAPMSDIAVVKLKPSKQYLKQYFAIAPSIEAYQENDIMLGLRYLDELAQREGKPLVICLGLGTNMGGHNGTSPLSGYLNILSSKPERCVVTAGGNEADKGHHFYGNITFPQAYKDVEVRVDSEEYGLMMELWSNTPDVLSVSMESPTGEEIPRITAEAGNQRFDFLFEESVVYVEFLSLEAGSGDQLIVIRMFRPSAGIWRLRVYGDQVVSGRFHVWLPITGFLLKNTEFLASDPETTLTEPSNSEGVITVGAYRAENGSIASFSGRGYTRNGRIKPDLAAPGVNIPAYAQQDRFGELSGTSASAAITAGAAALILEWAVVKGRRPQISTLEIKQLLIRGADRTENQVYPNPIWGYGKLDLYGSFEALGRF